ncbi:MAG: threonylcarbamoyl-AMP synthase, partial [bacterium]|nr:threonylcarbamoyl-AMP synthase [bacterium]
MTRVIDIGQVGLDRSIRQALKVLKDGGLVIYPTDTCYGAGVDAANAKAVDKLLKFKGSRRNRPISVAVSDVKMAKKYVKINKTAAFFYKHFLPGPYTVVSEYKGGLDDRLVSPVRTLGIRIPDYDLVLKMVGLLNGPITSTSANPSGQRTPYSVKEDILGLAGKKLDYVDLVLDAGRLPKRPPSVVVDTTGESVNVLRGSDWPFLPVLSSVHSTHSFQETVELGAKLAAEILASGDDRPVVILLSGILGSGKTHLVKGIAKGLGVGELVKSPSFVLVKEYEGARGRLVHADLWRLKRAEDVAGLGLEAYFKKGVWLAIEWVEKSIKFVGSWLDKARVLVVEID